MFYCEVMYLYGVKQIGKLRLPDDIISTWERNKT